MTSPKQAAANRRNAQRSTGPRSVDGKVVSARNALRHGVVSRVEVLYGLEDADAYEEHVRQTHEALGPVGHLEETLADRISSVTWRLGRAVRAERDLAAARSERLAVARCSSGTGRMAGTTRAMTLLASDYAAAGLRRPECKAGRVNTSLLIEQLLERHRAELEAEIGR